MKKNILFLLQSARMCTLSNMNTAETSWPINIKFHLEHYWGEELAKGPRTVLMKDCP